ncbi:MAG TPA: pyridoxamine 5'-phosphate oxidase family protein, partial [Ktedonobacteraceae bacterium]|nr:pyridoxamine 5'-phosphate oxidase family protein [Ktedonobacteraceae bacterium]
MSRLNLSPEISRVLQEYYTCEITTVNRQGQPITWPCLPYYDEASGQILLSMSIAFPVKAFNARQHPQVSLLYSDPTGSGLDRAPALLIQGDATVSELLDYGSPVMRSAFRASLKRQPESRRIISNRLVRKCFAWYIFQRLLITV